MRAVAAGITDVGRERTHNEDRFVLLPEFEVFVVADGMGGHQCGEVASRMATTAIAGYFRAQREGRANGGVPDILRAALLEANSRIHRRAKSSPLHRGMGTTVVAAAFHREAETLYVAHAGDSRCYRLRSGALSRLTRDHSLVEEALRTRPDITRSELAYLPANVITRALGVEPTLQVDIATERVEAGDLYLLCSDGLHGFVNDERLAEILDEQDVLTSACALLVAEANKNGGGDNITAVLVRIEPVDAPWRVSTSVPPPPSRLPTEPPGGAPPIPAIPRPGAVGVDADDTEQMPALTMAEAADALDVDDTAKMPVVRDHEAAPAVGAELPTASTGHQGADEDEEQELDEDSLPPPPTKPPPPRR